MRTAIFGENGLAKGLKPGTLVADMTTGDPLQTKAMAAELAKRGIDMIDAPVSGGPDGATAGTLAIMVGGTAALFARIKPVFEKVGPNVYHMGDVGAGQTMKLVNNMLHRRLQGDDLRGDGAGRQERARSQARRRRPAEELGPQRHHGKDPAEAPSMGISAAPSRSA